MPFANEAGQLDPAMLSDGDWIEMAYSSGEVFEDQRLVDCGYKLTAEHWRDIYRALCDKLARVNAGDYDDHPADRVCREWSAHLGAIIAKIGDDGARAALHYGELPYVARNELGGTH